MNDDENRQYNRVTIADLCDQLSDHTIFNDALNSRFINRGFIFPQFVYVAITGNLRTCFALNIGLTEDEAVKALKSDMDYITKHAFTLSPADISIIVLPLKTIIDHRG